MTDEIPRIGPAVTTKVELAQEVVIALACEIMGNWVLQDKRLQLALSHLDRLPPRALERLYDLGWDVAKILADAHPDDCPHGKL